MFRRIGVAAAAALLLAGCGGPAAAPAGPPGDCRQPPEAVLPRTAGTLGETESGSFCLAVGEQLSVFLTADRATGDQLRWAPVTSSDPGVLVPTGTGVLTAPVGVTPGIFRGTRPGTARLVSRLGADRDWQVTVVVR